MLTQSVLHELNQLIAHMRTILTNCDKAIFTQLIDSMANCLIAIRSSAKSHFRIKSEGARSHRYMRNLLGRHIRSNGRDFRIRDVLDISTVKEFFGTTARTVTLSNVSTDGISPAEEALWPREQMVEKLTGYRRTIAKREEDSEIDYHDGNRSLFTSPFCKSLVFGLLTSLLLVVFYLYTGSASLARLLEPDCEKFCQMEMVDLLVRKLIGISASACQIGAIIVIIYNLNKLAPIL